METGLLLDVEQELYLERAPLGRRFANLVVDTIGFYIFVFAVFFMLGALSAFSGSTILAEDASFLLVVISFTCYLLYFTLAEGLTKGRSLGKLITGTVVLKTDGSAITWKDALLRSLCRLVPFEAFSAFGYAPWHDEWTKTIVVKKAG